MLGCMLGFFLDTYQKLCYSSRVLTTQRKYNMKTLKIALIRISSTGYSDWNTDYIVNAITEWQEVTQEEYNLLYDYSVRTREFFIIQKLDEDEVRFAIKDQLEYIRKQAEVRQLEQKKREELRIKRKAKLEEKKLEEKKKLFEILKKELGNE